LKETRTTTDRNRQKQTKISDKGDSSRQKQPTDRTMDRSGRVPVNMKNRKEKERERERTGMNKIKNADRTMKPNTNKEKKERDN
jgi:hypothetical protein